MTDQWAKGQDAEELIKLDDDEVYGDLEDLETGQVVSGENEEEEEEELPRMADLILKESERDAEMAKRKERMERKLKLKRSLTLIMMEERGIRTLTMTPRECSTRGTGQACT